MVQFKHLSLEQEKAIMNRVGSKVRDHFSLSMDLAAANADCGMDVVKLIAFDDFNFWHDITGIMANINRETGKLENCFVPRCARHTA